MLRFIAVLLLVSAPCFAQATQSLERGPLQIRADQEFNRGQYASALPMYKKLVELSKNEPDVVGPIEEKIRVCEKNISAAGAAKTTLNANRKPHPAPKDGEVLEMTIKDLGNFDYDADNGGAIPEDVQKLSGHKIRLRGFMIPIDQAARITQFALVADLFSCCFGQPPQIQHTVVVNCPKGKEASYYPDEITVEGTLKVAEKKDEGFIVSIFELEVSSVKPSAK